VAWVAGRDATAPFAYIVTPNVDHLVRLNRMPRHSEIRAAYERADRCVCDSQIVRMLAHLGGVKLPLVRGSDLAEAMVAEAVPAGARVTLIGGNEAIAARLAAKLPQIKLRHHAPPMGLLSNPEAIASTVQFIEDHPADLVFLAVGSPQQELIAYTARARGRAKGTGLCIGAGIEFVTGDKQRAPRWMSASGLEWFHRLLTEPKRLWRRYLIDDVRIVPITLRWLCKPR
jgi:exopolysaccharide biosynthesis WecB/TagA/CpsF family protein